MPIFKTEVMKTRQLYDAKQTTLKLSKPKGQIKLDEVSGILNKFEATALKGKHNTQTMVRLPTILGPRTFKMFSGELNFDKYNEYMDGKVEETSKFEELSYIEVTVMKSFGIEDYFA